MGSLGEAMRDHMPMLLLLAMMAIIGLGLAFLAFGFYKNRSWIAAMIPA